MENKGNTKPFNVKEYAQELIKMANEFNAKDFKKNALKELDELEEQNIVIPHTAFIVHNYPDFNHIEIKLTEPNKFTFKIDVNPEEIKKNPQLAYELANMYSSWIAAGAKEENI